MNSTKRFSRKDYSSAPYFRYYMKHNIYQLALFLVITALTMVVPCIIEMGKRRAWSNAFDRLCAQRIYVTVLRNDGSFIRQ